MPEDYAPVSLAPYKDVLQTLYIVAKAAGFGVHLRSISHSRE